MTWALKRQIFYVVVLLLFLGVSGFLIIYPSLNKPPTCSDGIQNGNETGVDCGGSCPLACTAQVDSIFILWSRVFKVVPGRYNAVAYLENHNQNNVINKINYRFRFADTNNIYIGKREGATFVPPGGKFVVFEPAIDIGNSIPVYTSFEFTETPQWIVVPKEKINQLKVAVSNIQLQNEDTNPALSATIQNNSLFIIPAINVMTILYDASGNAVSASRSYLDVLKGGQKAEVNFTWPEPFSAKIIATEIIPMYNIFLVKIK